MDMFKPAFAAVAALTLIGVAPVHAWCQQSVKTDSVKVQTASTPPPNDAVVMPAPQEVQVQLTAVGQRLKNAEKASFYSPDAENEYLDAQRMYRLGQYDVAADDLKAAENALPNIRSWGNVKVVAHKD